MTRKEALRLAIQALSETGQSEEAVAVLQTMREELPLNRWSEAAIKDSIEQFVLDNGRIPNVSDFKNRGLPPHPVIKNRYGKNLKEWLYETYPDIPELQKKAQTAATERFVREYLALRPKSASEFNKARSPDCFCWYTVARYNQVNTWRALLARLDLPVFSRAAVPEKKRDYYVRFETSLDDMEPCRRDVLRKMVEEGHPAFPAPNFQITLQKDEKDPAVEHFILRYVTDKRLAYEMQSSGEKKKCIQDD